MIYFRYIREFSLFKCQKHFILHVHVSKPAEEDIQGKPWYPTHLRSSIAYVNLKTFNLWPQDYAVFYIT